MTVQDKKTKECIGKCPKCGGGNLDYLSSDCGGYMLSYPFTCEDCGCEGEEVYSITYIETKYD